MKNRISMVSLLAKIDFLVPFPPNFGWSEHTTGTTLVTECSLAGAVSATTRDTRDTGDSAS
jgi:hypothetical protein